jgi:hypothetical protein
LAKKVYVAYQARKKYEVEIAIELRWRVFLPLPLVICHLVDFSWDMLL